MKPPLSAMLPYLTLFGSFMLLSRKVYSTESSDSSSYTYCYNYTECQNETIDTTYASCYGYYGCDEADITSSSTLAYGELAAYDATIDSKDTYSYGHYATYASSVSTYHLYSYGYQSARIADVEPYDNELDLYYYGYYSGSGSDISCYSGDTCNIYCGSGKGCYDSKFYCYSGATCYYDCSGDDVCPTSYSGVDSDLTYVTSAGTFDASSSSYASSSGAADAAVADLEAVAEGVSVNKKEISITGDGTGTGGAVVITGLTDEEITEYKMGNQLAKDKSKIKLQQDTLDDTNLQLQMTFEQEYWITGILGQQLQAEKEAREREEREDREDRENKNVDIAIEPQSKVLTQKLYPNVQAFKNYKNNNNMIGRGKGLFFGISLEEYGMALVIDICIIAIIIQTYKYYIKTKAYQSL